MSIVAMIVGTLGALARGVQEGYIYTEGHGTATQHARVALERIAATVREATASPEFPGALVVSSEEAGWEFPDTLVVWHPEGDPVDGDGLPRFNELVIYCPDPYTPSHLVEMTFPSDTSTVPPADATAQWESAIESLKTNSYRQSIMLTDLLRTVQVESTLASSERGSAWFAVRRRPSADEWEDYQAGSADWEDLAWVQGIHGTESGLSQTSVRIELQLMPGDRAAEDSDGPASPIPFFGSAALYYELPR